MSGGTAHSTAATRGRRVALTGLVAIVLVWAAAVAYRLGWWHTGTLDLAWNRSVASAAGSAGRALSEFLATVGTGGPAIIAAVVLGAAIGVRRGSYWGLVALAISSLSALQVTLMKATAARARPDAAYGLDNAFPSGHTTNAAVMATLAAVLLLQGRARWLLLLYPLLMGWSRTVLHAHWLTDVTAGTLLGASTVAVLVWAAAALERRHRMRRETRGWTRQSAGPDRV